MKTLYAHAGAERMMYPENSIFSAMPDILSVEEIKQYIVLEILKKFDTFKITKWEVTQFPRKFGDAANIVKCTFEVEDEGENTERSVEYVDKKI